MPYADVLVLVEAVVVVAAAALLFVVVLAAGVLAGGATAGMAGVAGVIIVAVVLLSGVVETGRAGVVATGAVLVAVTAEGAETAGVVTGVGLATTDAALTESEFVPPPPPHAARVVATRVESTRKVIVLDKVFMSIYSELRSVEYCYRLFIVGLWNTSILIQGNRFHTEKVVFRQHNVVLCHRNLTHFLLSLKDCYRSALSIGEPLLPAFVFGAGIAARLRWHISSGEFLEGLAVDVSL